MKTLLGIIELKHDIYDKIKNVNYCEKYGLKDLDYYYNHSFEIIEITKNDIALIKNLEFNESEEFRGYDETLDKSFIETISVDIKRPYGSKYILSDMLRILSIDESIDELTKQDFDILYQLHKKCATVLNICVNQLSFDIGVYIRIIPIGTWIKIK